MCVCEVHLYSLWLQFASQLGAFQLKLVQLRNQRLQLMHVLYIYISVLGVMCSLISKLWAQNSLSCKLFCGTYKVNLHVNTIKLRNYCCFALPVMQNNHNYPFVIIRGAQPKQYFSL